MICSHTSPLHCFASADLCCFMLYIWKLGRRGRLKILWPSAFCLWEHPSSNQCLRGVKADFSLETTIQQLCQMHNLHLSNILLLLRHFRVQGGRRRWQWTLNLSLGTRLSLLCSASTAMPSPPWLPVPPHPWLLIAGCSHVWNELLQNVSCATKSQRTVLFSLHWMWIERSPNVE